MQSRARFALGLGLIVSVATVLVAEPIRWRNPQGSTPAATARPPQAGGQPLPRHIVVQFNSLPAAGERARLEADGVRLLEYLGSNAYFAVASASKPALAGTSLANAGGAIIPIEPGHKLHPMLARGEFPAYARWANGTPQGRMQDTALPPQPSETAALYVVFHRDIDLLTAGAATISNHGGKLRDLMPSINGAVVWLPSSQLAALAADDAVQWIEPPLPPMRPTNNTNRAVTQAEQVQAPPYSLDGSGVSVLVYDGGTASASHADFGGRLFVRDGSGLSSHATHVCGTIGGAGTLSGGLYRGMAPAITIQSYGFEFDGTGQFLYTNPGDIESNYRDAIDNHGAAIANNSIGTNLASNGLTCSWEGDYGATSMLIDGIVAGSLGAPMRVVWAVGNERGDGRCGTAYRTIAPPSAAKNPVAVGAVNANDESMTGFSSWGPTDDGRLKPDVCAPGCQVGGDSGVTSTSNSGGYEVLCGTSMAAPTVTGGCSLILQDYRARFAERPLPRNSTLKALLAHNARDLGNVGPDYRFGYGAVRIKDTIDFLRRDSFVEETLAAGEQKVYLVSVPAGAVALKATLAWDDPPAALNTTHQLVNDLDLLAVAPDGTTIHHPWRLDPDEPSAPAIRTGPDSINNIEQVVVDAPAAGLWQIRVNGFAVAAGPQVFSLCTSPDLRRCSSQGTVAFGATAYACASTATIAVVDCDRDLDPQAVDSVSVTVAGPAQPAGISLSLSETAPSSAVFVADLALSATGEPGKLTVADGQTITATYVDPDNGLGGTNVSSSSTAAIDCRAAAVTSLSIDPIGAMHAGVNIATDEPTRVSIRFGPDCADLNRLMSSTALLTRHEPLLADLSPSSPWFLSIELMDRVGNRTILPADESCYSFTTTQRRKYFTELFDAEHPFDLAGRSLAFDPDGSIHRYSACITSAANLPVDPAGSTRLTLGDDNHAKVTLTGGKRVWLYGTSYNAFYVGSNGYLSFSGGDANMLESPAAHFSRPRISAFFDDLHPPENAASGGVLWKQTENLVAITWDRVPEYNTTAPNTFQIVLQFDGRIILAWSSMKAVDGLVGLSEGSGLPDDYLPADLSALSGCSVLPGQATSPVPAQWATRIGVKPTLSWTAGVAADSHDVYFGTNAGTMVRYGNQLTTSFAPGVLQAATRYCWRVDEVNSAGTTPGEVWEFTTAPVPPDFDGDGDVDLEDYGHLQICISGSNVVQAEVGCADTRLDGDLDVDADDLQLFQNCLGGPDVHAPPLCMSP